MMKFPRRQACVTLVALVASLFVFGAFAQTAPPSPKPQLPTPQVPVAPVPPPPQFKSKSWVLMDYATGRILASKKPDMRVAPASITKIMTAFVVAAELKAGKIHMNDMVYISTKAWKQGGVSSGSSTMFLKVHSKVSVKNLLYGMLVQSGNDAAIALAQHTAGSTQSFVSLMNAYAKRLGMTGTHYSDVDGFPIADHYSTARDTAVLTRAFIRDFPKIYKIASVKKFTWDGITQYNRNTLLWSDPSVDGVKTGHTEAAGYCLVASAVRKGERLIAVVMGTPSYNARDTDADALLNYGYRFFGTHTLYKAGQALAKPRLWKGQSNHLPIGLTSNLAVTVQRGNYTKLQANISIPATLIAPFKKGQKVGTLTITLKGKTLLTRPVVALAGAPEGGFFSRLWDTIMLWFYGNHSNKQTTVQPATAQSAPSTKTAS